MSSDNAIFEGPALITLEGDAVFSFVAREQNRANYVVIGLYGKALIRVMDYRAQGLSAIDAFVKTEDDSRFAEQFCYPSRIQIRKENTEVLIKLFDLDENIQPDFMLWIATGVEEPIPDYEYSFFRIEPLTENTFSLVSVFNYRRFQKYFDGLAIQTPVGMES